MPVHTERRGGKYRLIEPDGSVATTPNGKPRDGGGHPSRNMANRQARAINSSLHKSVRSLYLCRPLLNSDALISWAKTEGFSQTLQASDMHVTIAFSRKAVDWSLIETRKTRIRISGDHRSVQHLRDKGAVVLMFQSDKLNQRWSELREIGASWDYGSYHPHVTITYKGSVNDPTSVMPFTGDLVFGPERMEELEEDWDIKIDEQKVAARLYDAIAKGELSL